MHFNTYDHFITVNQAHLDILAHVNNVVYLQWVQDAASAHWSAGVSAAVAKQFHWVALRHEIDYKSPALLGDQLIAKTWVHDYQGVKSVRIVQIIRSADNKLLAEAKSTWCLINTHTGRPTRIAEEIKASFRPEHQD